MIFDLSLQVDDRFSKYLKNKETQKHLIRSNEKGLLQKHQSFKAHSLNLIYTDHQGVKIKLKMKKQTEIEL